MKKYPVIASEFLYYRTFGEKLNLKKPTTFNEKLMWLKLNEDYSLKTTCADKYLVRNYVRQSGYSKLLIDLYEVYEDVEEIDFKKLPDRFVMKCTHGSGFNIICRNKEEIDEAKIKLQLKKWMNMDYSLVSAETHYSSIKPRVIIEKFLSDKNHKNFLIDYMIHCFNGEPQFIEIGLDYGNAEKEFALFTTDWELSPFLEVGANISRFINRPEKLDEMLEISRELSKVFTYVRVDLYFCNNEIYFGELTFTPAACLEIDFINNGDNLMGELLDLPVLKRKRSSVFSKLKGVK